MWGADNMTAADFKARWSEFAETSSDLVTAVIAESVAQTDARVFGDNYALAVGLQTAHALATEPFGQNSSQQEDKGESPYLKRYKDLVSVCAGGGIAVGQLPGDDLDALKARLGIL